MTEFLQQIAAFPTVIYTGLLGLVIVYWVFVIFGAFDIDFLESGIEGLGEGAVEGLAEGAAEGLAEGAAEGLAEGAAEGLAEGAAEGASDGLLEGGMSLAGLLHSLKLRKAPVTVVLSSIVLWSWALSFLLMEHVAPLLAGIVPGWLFGMGAMIGAFVGSVPITSVLIRPLGPLFETQIGGHHVELIGQSCTVTTGKVTDRFGQATVADRGAGLLIQVRCPRDNRLKKGHEALIVDWDPQSHCFLIEPVSPEDAEEARNLDAVSDPRRLPQSNKQSS